MTDSCCSNIIVQQELSSVIIGEGSQGVPGIPGEGTAVYIIASIDLGGHRVVKSTDNGCAYADSSDISDIGKVLGITSSAYSSGSLATIHTSSEIIEPSWNFTPGAVYLGSNGLLTQIVPSVGFIQQIGVATAPTKLVVQIQPPIKLT